MFRTLILAASLFLSPAALACGGYMPAMNLEIEDASFEVFMTSVERAEKVGELYLIAGRYWEGDDLTFTLRRADGEIIRTWTKPSVLTAVAAGV